LFEFSSQIVMVSHRKYKKSALSGKHRGNWKLGQDVAQREKMGNECSMWQTSKKWKMYRKVSGKRSFVWDNNAKNSNRGTV